MVTVQYIALCDELQGRTQEGHIDIKIILEEIPGISKIINQSCTDANQSTPLDLVYTRAINEEHKWSPALSNQEEEEIWHRDCKIRIDMIQLLRKHGGKRKSEM